MPVVQNVARDPAGNPSRATVTIRLIAGDIGSVNTPGYSPDGSVIGTTTVRADGDGTWSVDLDPNDDYLPVGTYYEIAEQPAGTHIVYVHYAEVPDVAGPVELVGILVDPVEVPDSLYLLVTQKGAAGGLATLDEDGQVPADQLANASGGGGGGAVASVFGRTGVVTAQTGDYTKAQVGLSNVDNTTDVGKPVSTAQAAADTAVALAAASALALHEADTTAVHGIANTANLVLNTRQVIAGTGLSGGGTLAADRTLTVSYGATAATAAEGNDSRLSDARTPTAHAASHASAGGDPVTLAQSQVTGLTAALAAKQDGDADLTTIAGLAATTDNVIQSVGSAWASRTPAQLKTTLALVKGDVGLGNVDNTTDAGKPISTATQTALDAKQPLDADLTTIAALTATTDNMIQSVGSAWASRTPTQVKTALALNNLDNTSDAGKPVSTAQQTALDLKANLASPTFTGTPALPTGTTGVTQTAGNSSTALATTAFVTTADNLKADLASPVLTGNPTAPTQSQGNNSTRIATTAYVQTEAGLLVPKSLVDAKGDLLVGTANDTVARLAVGADTFVLTADSAQSSGVKWAAASGGGTADSSRAYPKTGLWYRAPSYGPVGANLTLVQNRLYMVPFRVGLTFTADRIGCDVATVGAAGCVLRLGIFNADSTNQLPGTLVLDAGTVQADTGTGSRTITINQALSAGIYWLGVVMQTASGALLRATVNYDPLLPYFTGANAVTGTESAASVFANSITGALASTPTLVDNDRGPLLSVRST